MQLIDLLNVVATNDTVEIVVIDRSGTKEIASCKNKANILIEDLHDHDNAKEYYGGAFDYIWEDSEVDCCYANDNDFVIEIYAD